MKEGMQEVEKGHTLLYSTSLASLKELMFTYQHTIKEARNSYFSDLTNHGHSPRIPFKVVKSVTGPPPSQPVEPSNDNCEQFLNYFINKIEEIHKQLKTDLKDSDND